MVNFGEKHTSWFDLYTHIVAKTLCIHDKKITCFMLLSNYIPYLPFLFHRVRICILWRYEKCYKTRSRRMNSSTLCSHAPYSWHHCKKCVSKNVELSYQAFWKDQIQILQYHRFQVKIPSMPSNPSVSDALILCTQWRQVFYHRMSLQFIHHKPQLEAHLCINTGPVMGVPLYDLIVCYVDYLLAAFKIHNTEQYIFHVYYLGPILKRNLDFP